MIAALALLVVCAAIVPAPASAAGTWTWPVEGRVVTPYDFGDDPYAAGQHRGIDIAAPAGEPVAAATAGTVTFAGTAASSGLTVSIRTADDRFDTSYLHLDSIGVGEGDRVEAGTELGRVGTSGERSAAPPHVHFGVRDAGERHGYRDPLLFLAPTGTPAPPPPSAPLPARRRPPPLPEAVPRPLRGPGPVRAPASEPVPRPVPAPAPSLAPRRAPAVAPGGRLDLGQALGWGGLGIAAATLIGSAAVQQRRARSARRRRAARAGTASAAPSHPAPGPYRRAGGARRANGPQVASGRGLLRHHADLLRER